VVEQLVESSSSHGLIHAVDAPGRAAAYESFVFTALRAVFLRLAAARGVEFGQSRHVSDTENLRTACSLLYDATGSPLFDVSGDAFDMLTAIPADDIDRALSRLDTIDYSTAEIEEFGQAYEQLLGFELGDKGLSRGDKRRKSGSHYTPRSLTEPIVERALEPLLERFDGGPSSAQILSLNVCDPAMGAGAFLIQACRFLAGRVTEAWAREGQEASESKALRFVAQRCLYGVDKNETAVHVARLSLWLLTMSKDEPFTFVDHALRHGDSLVGLDHQQLRDFHWLKGGPHRMGLAPIVELLEQSREAASLRRRIQHMAGSGSLDAHREKARLLSEADTHGDKLKLVGDVALGAFFSATKDKDRETERERRLALVLRWLGGDASVEPQLQAMQQVIRADHAPFHWEVEFPEVFEARGRPAT
jgi:hypothetical protein